MNIIKFILGVSLLINSMFFVPLYNNIHLTEKDPLTYTLIILMIWFSITSYEEIYEKSLRRDIK